MFIERHEVAINYDGWRLDRFLADRMRRASRAKVARIIRAGVEIEREGGAPKIKAGTVVRSGDVVLVHRRERGDPGAPGIDAVRELARGPSFIALSKPAGLLVHRTAHEATRTVEAYLAEHHPGEGVRPVHRLDRDTSGVLLCARGVEAARALVAQFERSDPEKTYVATVEDPGRVWVPGATRSIDTPLGFAGSEVEIRVGEGDWACATHVRCLRRVGEARAELEVTIERGRQHQIRAHLFMCGTPIVGDKLYGMGDAFFVSWLAEPGAPELVAQLATRWHCLHARALRVELDGEMRSFEAPLPPHWPGGGA